MTLKALGSWHNKSYIFSFSHFFPNKRTRVVGIYERPCLGQTRIDAFLGRQVLKIIINHDTVMVVDTSGCGAWNSGIVFKA